MAQHLPCVPSFVSGISNERVTGDCERANQRPWKLQPIGGDAAADFDG